MILSQQTIKIYTDGSCNPQYKIGAWASLIFIDKEKVVLQSTEIETTHNRMEMIAVIESIEYVLEKCSNYNAIEIYTDSQYVERIPIRTQKLISKDFKTKKGTAIQNLDLVKELIALLNSTNVAFIKVKAHQKTSETPNFNREVDMISRRLVRQELNKINKEL